MKQEAKDSIHWLAQRIDTCELAEFLRLFGGLRITIPTIRSYAAIARDLEVLDDYRSAPHGSLSDFYRAQARKRGCSTASIQRALKRALSEQKAA